MFFLKQERLFLIKLVIRINDQSFGNKKKKKSFLNLYRSIIKNLYLRYMQILYTQQIINPTFSSLPHCGVRFFTDC